MLGSVLYLLINFVMQESPEENLAIVWDFIQLAYDAYGSENRYSVLRMTMFHAKSQPKMRGKAAEIKDFLPVVLALWRHFGNQKLILHQKILYVLEGLMSLLKKPIFKVF